MAAMCGYSSEYFTRIFKKLIGIPPKKYIINLRIENALHEISAKNINILDAALEAGFQSSSSFYRAFNAYKLASPLKYIRAMT
jgi:AraC family transcriptional regulator